MRRRKDALRPRFAGGGCAAVEDSLSLDKLRITRGARAEGGGVEGELAPAQFTGPRGARAGGGMEGELALAQFTGPRGARAEII